MNDNVKSIAQARASKEESDLKVESYFFTEKELENMLLREVRSALGQDRDALKAFEVKVFKPVNAEQALALKRVGKQLFVVHGALGLDDSGVGLKAFSFNIEQGLSIKQEKDLASQLAHQCKICIAKMKRDRIANPNRRILRVGR